MSDKRAASMIHGACEQLTVSALLSHAQRDRTHHPHGQRPLIFPTLLLSLTRHPSAGDEIVRILPRPVEVVVLDVANDRVDSILQGSLLGALAGAV